MSVANCFFALEKQNATKANFENRTFENWNAANFFYKFWKQSDKILFMYQTLVNRQTLELVYR